MERFRESRVALGQEDLGSCHSISQLMPRSLGSRHVSTAPAKMPVRFGQENEDGHRTESRALAKLAPFKEPFRKAHPLTSSCVLLAGAVLRDHPYLKWTGKCALH